jgi:hypothetical protein
MSRCDFHPVTQEPCPQEARPARGPQPRQRFQAAPADPGSKPDSGHQVEANTADPPSGANSRVESVDACHQQERTRLEQGNRGPEEETGFGQGA